MMALLHDWKEMRRASNQLSLTQKVKSKNMRNGTSSKTFPAVHTKAEKVLNASLTQVTHSFWSSSSSVEAVGGQPTPECLCAAIYSKAHLVQCGIWRQALGDLPEPCARIKVEATTHLCSLPNLVIAFFFFFYIKQVYQTLNLGQAMACGRKYPRMNSSDGACFKWRIFTSRFFFFNQFLHTALRWIDPSSAADIHSVFSGSS